MAPTAGSAQKSEMEEILDEWLGPGDVPDPARQARWWTKDSAFDAHLRERFGALLERAARGELDDWAETPRGALALVILLDQFSRNVHRGSARAFAQDTRALAITRRALERGFDRALSPMHRVFLLMPLMHSEDLADQRESVARFEALAAGAEGEVGRALEQNADYARQHLAIVERFGRYPHRNEILGRPSAPEEIEFLKQPGSSF